MKLRRGSPENDGKPGVSRMRAIEFAALPVSKRHEMNFTRKDSFPQRALLSDDGGDEISPPPLEGEVDARSAAGGVTALTGARASGGAEHPTPPACGGRPSPYRGG
jgi:hypothetical protein